jgi:hypothetical protein
VRRVPWIDVKWVPRIDRAEDEPERYHRVEHCGTLYHNEINHLHAG